MSHSLLIAFIVFASVMYFTPGPNNIIVLSSGLTYGFRPHHPGHRGDYLRLRLHGGRGGIRLRDHLRRLSDPADDPQICRRGLSGLSGRDDRHVGAGHAGAGHRPRVR